MASNQTRTGQLLGTPLYMSPEQCRGARQVDSRTDIYALGCIMFEIFCGRPPFVSPGLGDLIIAHVTQRPPDPLEFSPGLHPAIRQALLQCLEKEPADRPTVNALSAMLEAAGARDVVRLKSAVLTAGVAIPASPVRSPVEETVPEPIASMQPLAGRPRAHDLPLSAAATPRSGGAFLVTPPPTTLGGVATEVIVQRAARKRRTMIGIGTLSLAGLAAIAVVALRGPAREAVVPGAGVQDKAPAPVAETAAPRPPVPAAMAPAPAQPSAPAPAPAPPQPSTAAITLTGLPAESVFRLDGRPASSPPSSFRAAATSIDHRRG